MLARFTTTFRSIILVIHVVNSALSFLTIMISEATYTYMVFLFLFLFFLSLGSLCALFELRKIKEAKAVPPIVLLALAANGGWWVYTTTWALIMGVYRNSPQMLTRTYLILSFGILNLACFLASLLLLLSTRTIFLRKTRGIQTDRL